MQDTFLDRIYDAPDEAAKQRIYSEWAATYDADLGKSGYATPARCAQALHAVMPRTDLPVLDVGCGTGLSGVALRLAGFTVIDGCDPSAEMLAQARAKGVYRDLRTNDPAQPLPMGYAALTAVGVIGAGAAPLSVLDDMIGALDSGGFAVFSFNDHTLRDPAFQARVDALIADGTVTELMREHGDHVPAKGIGATVYALRKA